MNEQEEQKIKIKISSMTVVFSGETKGFRFPSGDSRMQNAEGAAVMLFFETQFSEKTFGFVTVHPLPGFTELLELTYYPWGEKIGDSYSCFREGKPLDLGVNSELLKG